MSLQPSDNREYTVEEIQEMMKGPIRCGPCRKTAAEAGLSKLRVCSACSSASYCSVDCQRKDWKEHKAHCRKVTSGESARAGMTMPVGNIGEASHSRRGRATGQVLQDLMAWALAHNGDTLPVTAWQALGLLSNIEARKSKVLLIGLRRTQSIVPRTYYTLKDACTVAVADLKPIFSTRTPTGSPYRILKDAEKESREDGHIGAMMVICMELLEDDERDLLTALGQISTANYQPLRVFEVTRTMVARIGQLPDNQWKACLANVLRGGLYLPTFRTS